MNGMITVITPTGDRAIAFGLCQRWIMQQTRTPDQWIVVDDGMAAMEPYCPVDYVRRITQASEPKHTLSRNIKAALPLIKGDKIMIIEDDEYYAPGYIEEMARRLDSSEVVGICNSKYYHLPTGGYENCKNMAHASLAETGFRASFLPVFSDCVDKGMDIYWLDDQMWRRIRESKGTARPITSELFVDSNEPLYVGMKGLPGRVGIGVGHNPAFYQNKHRDGVDRSQLRKWVPKDYQVYLDVLAGMRWLQGFMK